MPDVSQIFSWLVDGAPGAPTPVHTVARMGADLVTAGVPIDRIEAFVKTLHPHIVGRSFSWFPGGAVQVRENSYAFLHSPEFLGSPVAAVFRSGQPVRRQLGEPSAQTEYALLAELAAEGYTDYLAAPLTFMSGQFHAITFATKTAGGFVQADIAALLDLMRPLSRVAEIFALTRTAANLLNTYVGHDAGERILQGRIQRGDTDSLRAVLWFSDLRGFTAMSARMEPRAIIRVLNDLFDCQVPAIERRGGQVLKFIGDGLLAIFPLDNDRPPGPSCDAALDAAAEAQATLQVLNAGRVANDLEPIRFGLALHVGEVAYGNIGGSGRLDFTCIGPAVNLAARLESLTSQLGKQMVVSAEFAALTSRPSAQVGSFALKGVPGEVAVFEPAA